MFVDQGRARRNVSKCQLAQSRPSSQSMFPARQSKNGISQRCSTVLRQCRYDPWAFLRVTCPALCLLVIAPQDATLVGTIREPEIGSYAVWLYGDRDTASVMQWGPTTRVFPCPKDSRRTMRRRRYVRYGTMEVVSFQRMEKIDPVATAGELMRRGPRHARKRPHTKQQCKRWKDGGGLN